MGAGSQNDGINFMGYTIGIGMLLVVLVPVLILLCCCGFWVINVVTDNPRPAPSVTTEVGG